jgi:alginate O-acetyltransferase complex protein AlgJ
MHFDKLIAFLTRPCHRLVAGAFSAAFAVGFLCSADTLRHVAAEHQSFSPRGGSAVLLKREIENALRASYSHSINPILAGARYRFFGDLGSQVSEGCPGWMFYNNGFRAIFGGSEAFRQRLALAKYFVGELQKNGAEVLVVTVPDKARIETESLCGLHLASQVRDRLDLWHQYLQRLGVPYVDLREALVGVKPAFFRTDVHWNEQGAKAAAFAVASAASLIQHFTLKQEFSVQQSSVAEERIGDLLVLAGLDRTPANWRPAPDLERRSIIEAVHSGGLLDEPTPPEVMIAGSSSSRRSNFAEWLGLKLGQQMWNRSLDGGQFSGALQTALKDQERWPRNIRLIIWELPEMSLTLPLSEEERAALAALKTNK